MNATYYVLTKKGSISFHHPLLGLVTIHKGESIRDDLYQDVPKRQQQFFEPDPDTDELIEGLAKVPPGGSPE